VGARATRNASVDSGHALAEMDLTPRFTHAVARAAHARPVGEASTPVVTDGFSRAVVRDQRLSLSSTNVAVPKLDVLLTMGTSKAESRSRGQYASESRSTAQPEPRWYTRTSFFHRRQEGPSIAGFARTKRSPSSRSGGSN
jgi:hypothetical protein